MTTRKAVDLLDGFLKCNARFADREIESIREDPDHVGQLLVEWKPVVANWPAQSRPVESRSDSRPL